MQLRDTSTRATRNKCTKLHIYISFLTYKILFLLYHPCGKPTSRIYVLIFFQFASYITCTHIYRGVQAASREYRKRKFKSDWNIGIANKNSVRREHWNTVVNLLFEIKLRTMQRNRNLWQEKTTYKEIPRNLKQFEREFCNKLNYLSCYFGIVTRRIFFIFLKFLLARNTAGYNEEKVRVLCKFFHYLNFVEVYQKKRFVLVMGNESGFHVIKVRSRKLELSRAMSIIRQRSLKCSHSTEVSLGEVCNQGLANPLNSLVFTFFSLFE